jgi:hypothetical protein
MKYCNYLNAYESIHNFKFFIYYYWSIGIINLLISILITSKTISLLIDILIIILAVVVTLVVVILNAVLSSVSTAAHSHYPLLMSFYIRYGSKVTSIHSKLQIIGLVEKLSFGPKIGLTCYGLLTFANFEVFVLREIHFIHNTVAKFSLIKCLLLNH